ncbi:zinc finger CCCH domain-containing protein 19 [Tanacetum coccineum]
MVVASPLRMSSSFSGDPPTVSVKRSARRKLMMTSLMTSLEPLSMFGLNSARVHINTKPHVIHTLPKSYCGNVTTDDNEDVTQVIAPEKDSIIAPPSTPPGNDLNIAVESGSSWIDYIGPLTSDEIDSDKRWSYRDPNGNIHGLFSLAQLRSWKDYFPSNLQIWSYYGNVKEAILLHNALSRQTKDAG